MICSLTTEQRRTRQPYGVEGGEPGALGRNTWVKQPRETDGDLPDDADASAPLKPRKINIGGKATVFMGKGDRLLIETPGAGAWGAWGAPPDEDDGMHAQGCGHEHVKAWAPRGSLAEREAAQAAF